ncbi:MAG: FHA domain-containing protein [Gemmataceae bacterium]|nr:FHA domain-containing protein [Gemmataceae bacterium]
MDVKLIVQSPKQQTLRLRSPQTVVGRQRGCGVRIPSAQVSRQHCVLTFTHDVLVVEDLGSVNGTLLNGRRIAKREYVRPGDKLTIGPVTLLVQYQLSEAGVQHLLGADDEIVAVPFDALPADKHAEVEVVLEDDETAPLKVDESLDEPAPPLDPLEALRAIEAAATAAPKPARGRTTPTRPKPPSDLDFDTATATPSPPRPKVIPAPPAASSVDDEPFGIEAAPDASQILGQKNWQLPTGEDIREILAQIEKGKKLS